MINKIEEQKFYDKIGKIIGWDFSKMKYNVIDESKFKYFEEINKNITDETILLDLGTGGGEKLINLVSNNCLLKIGTDFSEEMIKSANNNSKEKKLPIRFIKMDSEILNFPDEFFNIICARHTPFAINEIYRILKKGGLFFSEQIDEDDCIELKKVFNRGQGYNDKIKLVNKIKEDFEKFDFKEVNFFDILQEEYYKTEEDLLFLLNNTPILPNFGNVIGDYEKFNQYTEKYKTEKGILLNRKLFGIKAVK